MENLIYLFAAPLLLPLINYGLLNVDCLYMLMCKSCEFFYSCLEKGFELMLFFRVYRLNLCFLGNSKCVVVLS